MATKFAHVVVVLFEVVGYLRETLEKFVVDMARHGDVVRNIFLFGQLEQMFQMFDVLLGWLVGAVEHVDLIQFDTVLVVLLLSVFGEVGRAKFTVTNETVVVEQVLLALSFGDERVDIGQVELLVGLDVP